MKSDASTLLHHEDIYVNIATGQYTCVELFLSKYVEIFNFVKNHNKKRPCRAFLSLPIMKVDKDLTLLGSNSSAG